MLKRSRTQGTQAETVSCSISHTILLQPAARYSTRSDEYQLEQTWEIFPTYLCTKLLIQSSQQVHVSLNFAGSAPAVSQGLFSWGTRNCLCLSRTWYILVAMSGLVVDKSFSSQGSVYILNRYAILVTAGLQFVWRREVPLLQWTVALRRSWCTSAAVAGLVADAMAFQAGLLITADMLYSGYQGL
jgi:hypothetical protein